MNINYKNPMKSLFLSAQSSVPYGFLLSFFGSPTLYCTAKQKIDERIAADGADTHREAFLLLRDDFDLLRLHGERRVPCAANERGLRGKSRRKEVSFRMRETRRKTRNHPKNTTWILPSPNIKSMEQSTMIVTINQ